MILRINIPGPMEATVSTDVVEMEIEPIFYRKDGRPIVLYLATEGADGESIQQYAINISGKSGELALVRRQPVSAKFDEDLEEETLDDAEEDEELLPGEASVGRN